ncbi:MAG TPA: DUF4214 domain-containing protein, partial [Pyrinomonadaceae bacterium]|nr:DUF4214 domain-containing protein [Pyrinomonadaceae bacterium]
MPLTSGPDVVAALAGHLFYRVKGKVTRNSSSSTMALPQGGPPLTNVALSSNGAIATASSTYSAAFPAASLNNGDRKGMNWGAGGNWNDATDNAFPDWVQIDFAGNKIISEINVVTLQDNFTAPSEPTETMTFSNYGVTAFDVQWWNGSGWATVSGGSVTGNNKVWRKFTFAGITTSKIRVLINNALAGSSRMVEVEAWGTTAPAYTNVALSSNGAIVSASSTYSAAFPTASLNNGDRKGMNWGAGGNWNDATDNAFPDWVQIDFAGNKIISEIDVVTLQDNFTAPSEPTGTMTFNNYGVTAFEVQWWNGSAWATISGGSVTGNNKVWRKFTFAGITTSKIRVLINNALAGSSRMVEVEAWGTTAGSNEDYIANFSQVALLRELNAVESSYWNDIFRSAQLNGQSSLVLARREFGKTLFESSEYAARNRSDQNYVYDLYKTYLMREPDQGGWEDWTAAVPLYGREQVRRGFDESAEFLNLTGAMSASGSPSSAASSLSSARLDPFNQPGSGLVARDAEWTVGLLSLPGRAELNLGLALTYSSMVWTQSGPYIYFDEDNNSPSPGFQIGFPTIQEKTFDAHVGDTIYVLATPGGRRVGLRQLGTSNIYEAADSSYLQLIDYSSSLLVRSTDGTQLTYAWFNNEWRCIQVKDRNGNYLTVNYDWLGHITTITDTLARTITFNYDTNHKLVSITQSWTVGGVPQAHTWATFGWSTLSLQTNFSSSMPVGAPNGSTIPVLTQVGLNDGSRYNFEYTSAGQVSVIRRFTSDNVQRAYTAHDYQSTSADCPRLSATRVSADNWTGINGVPAEVITQYSDPGDGSHQLIAPDGTVYKEFYAGSASFPPASAWAKGLVAQSETWSGGVRQKWTTLSWTQDNTGLTYQTNPRVIESNVHDANGNRRRTTTSYASFTLPSGSTCNLPSDTREYAADAVTILRHAQTSYLTSTTYLDRHLIGLVSTQSLYGVESGVETLASRAGFQYDETGSIQGTDAPVQHDNTNYASSLVSGRGNLSSIKRYDITDSSQFTVSSLRYNTAGAVVAQIDPLLHQTSLSYGDSFSDGNNSRNTLAYPTTITDADGFSSGVQYNFDFGAKTRAQGPPPAGQPQGVIQTFTYDSAARIDRVTTTNNGAYTRSIYGPNYVQHFSTVNSLADEAYAIQVFDGAGQVTASANNHPGSTGGYSAQDVVYDAMRRSVKRSNATEITGAWTPAGDDAAGWLYTQQSHDWLGRPLVTTNPDGTYKESGYTGCSCAGANVVTVTQEGSIVSGVTRKRQQKIYSDVLGRIAKEEILNWDGPGPYGTGGTVYSTVVNTYNARDQLTRSRQYDGPETSSSYQETLIDFDGFSRRRTLHAPEQQVDPNNGSSSDHDTITYLADDSIQRITDARGATSDFTWNARHQVTSITYTAPSGITPVAPVSFVYDGAGNRTAMNDGQGSTSYAYDQLSRMTSETRTFSGLGSFAINYSY